MSAEVYGKGAKDRFLYDPFLGAERIQTFTFEHENDLDFDMQPDDWKRRKGENFPHYVKMEIDRSEGYDGKQCLKLWANGGMAAYYSPQIPVDEKHSYVFEGWIRTEKLRNSAAIITLSFLNHKRQRIQRFVSKPISGTHTTWQQVQIGAVIPKDEARFCVIGCHLVNSKKSDITGTACFDHLWIGKLPRFTLESNYETHFRHTNSPIQIKSKVSGLDPQDFYRLHMQIQDYHGHQIHAKTFVLPKQEQTSQVNSSEVDNGENKADTKADVQNEDLIHEGDEILSQREPVIWQLPPQPQGYYEVHAQLERNKEMIVISSTSFVVLDMILNKQTKGEFGWSVPHGAHHIEVDDLIDIMNEAGIHWVKYPVWDYGTTKNTDLKSHTAIFLSELSTHNITPVGLLNHPPDELRRKFAKDWSGVSEIFSLHPSLWRNSIDSVMASFSSSVRYWQLGDDSDLSFVGSPHLSSLAATVKKEFDRIGLTTQIGFLLGRRNGDTPEKLHGRNISYARF